MDESLFNRLTCLDSNVSSFRDTDLDEPAQLAFQSYMNIHADIKTELEDNYPDIVAIALTHTLCQLISEIKNGEPGIGKSLQLKALDLLKKV